MGSLGAPILGLGALWGRRVPPYWVWGLLGVSRYHHVGSMSLQESLGVPILSLGVHRGLWVPPHWVWGL